MAKSYPVQTSFAAGEVSPKLFGRFETPGYQQGLRECTNMIVDSRGPIIKRPGFKHLLSTPGRDCRMFEFNYSRERAFIAVLTANTIQMINGAFGFGADEQVINSQFKSGLTAWNIEEVGEGRVIVSGDDTIILNPGDGDTGSNSAGIYQTLTDVDAGADHVVKVSGFFRGVASVPLQVHVGTSGSGSSELYQGDLDEFLQYHEKIINQPLAATVTVTIRARGQNGTGATNLNSTINSVSFSTEPDVVTPFSATTPYSEKDLATIQGVMHPSGRALILCHPQHPVQEITYTPATGAWTYQARSLTSPPAEWVAGNYPGTSEFFQGRHWFAGTPDDPETLWASESGNYRNLLPGVNADDPLKFTITDHGLITWMLAGKDLLIGTALKEMILTSEGGVITPTDREVEQQSAYGSASIQPVLLGTEALFISSSNTKLYSQWYQWTEAGYLTRDITYTNDHITRESIRHLAYQREPEQTIWMPLEDGSLVGCTYHRDGNDKPIFGWHKHRVNGMVLDCASIQEEKRTSLVVAVLVTVDGANAIHIMIMDNSVAAENSGSNNASFNFGSSEQSTSSQQIETNQGLRNVYLDDFTHVVSDAVAMSVSGLGYLEGKTVIAVNDGAVEIPKVVTSGSIALDNPGVNISVGVPYTGRIVTLPLVTQAPGGGATAPWMKHRSKIYLRVLSSAQPLVNGTRPAERSPLAPMGLAQPVDSTDFFISNTGLDTEAGIIVEQDLPKPLNVVAIFGEVNQESI